MLCNQHGEAEACLICSHLRKGRSRGFNPVVPARADGVPEVVCDRCALWARMPGPVAKAQAFLFGDRMRVCEHCLVLIRIANERTSPTS